MKTAKKLTEELYQITSSGYQADKIDFIQAETLIMILAKVDRIATALEEMKGGDDLKDVPIWDGKQFVVNGVPLTCKACGDGGCKQQGKDKPGCQSWRPKDVRLQDHFPQETP